MEGLTDNWDYPVLPSLRTIVCSPLSISAIDIDAIVGLLQMRKGIDASILSLQVLVIEPARWCDKGRGVDAAEFERRVEGLTKIEIHEHSYGSCSAEASPSCKYRC